MWYLFWIIAKNMIATLILVTCIKEILIIILRAEFRNIEVCIVCYVTITWNYNIIHTGFFFLKMNSNLSLHKIQILMLIRKKFFPEHSFSLKYSKNCFFATVNQSSYTPNSTKNPCDLSSRTNIPFMGPYIYIYNIYQTFSCKIHFLNIK